MSGDAIQGQGAGAAAAGGGGETIVRGQNFLVAPRYVQCPVTHKTQEPGARASS